MREMRDHIEAAERNEKCCASGVATRPADWSMTATAKPHRVSDLEAVPLAIAGHDLRQPLQVIQSAHELLGLRVRTSSDLRYLRSGQNELDRLKEQLEQRLTALRVRERTRRPEPQVLPQACRAKRCRRYSRFSPALMPHNVTAWANYSGYLAPANADIPEPETLFVGEFDEEASPLGAKGLGELTAASVAPAIANAVYHATGKHTRSADHNREAPLTDLNAIGGLKSIPQRNKAYRSVASAAASGNG